MIATPATLASRRAAIAASPVLAAMRARLLGELEPFLSRPVYVPTDKALLSRWGSMCRDCHGELGFDPWSPDEQRCRGCGRRWSTPQTRRWWVYWYQLWLAERILQAALLDGLAGDPRCGAKAAEALAAVVERYQDYPNADNVLGPSRPFFSTYLESIWVMQLATAASLLAGAGRVPGPLAADLKSRLFRPSAELILDFDEGRSNRQVWNAAALYALGGVLDDASLRSGAVGGPSGLLASIERGLLDDGLWYEGENYHWFTLRGLSWGAELLREAGDVDLWTSDAAPGRKFRAAFRAPVLTALPDFTFPARRDSRFGVSLRQRRMAELWEMRLARTRGQEGPEGQDRTFLASLLAHVYDPGQPQPGDTAALITEVERGDEAPGVRREALGWKALLWARPELPPAPPEAWRPGTVHLEATGLAVFRRDEGRTYVSLDYGESGGGHGHPDRLNLTCVVRDVPWLLDFGTGSYVSPSLGWYRTSLAHNAPYLDGASQLPANGHCVAYEVAGDYGWVCAQLPENTAVDGATLQRTIVVTPGYVLDVLQMGSSTGERQLVLPWHGLGEVEADELGLTFTRPESALRVLLSAREPFQVQFGEGYGPAVPGREDERRRFAVVVSQGEEATLAACLSTGGAVEELECIEDGFVVRLAKGGMHVHTATDEGWHIEREHGDPIVLRGLRELPAQPHAARAGPTPATERIFSPLAAAPGLAAKAPAAAGRALRVKRRPPLDGSLGGFRTDAPLLLERAEQFRRAEEPWEGAERFAARAWLNHDDDTLYVAVEVTAPEPAFRAPDAADPELENETPDIHSDGLQVYIATSFFYGWVIVPHGDDRARLRATPARGTDAETGMVHGGWSPTERGYRVTFAVALPDAAEGFGFDLLVNRAREGRQRRVGQLVWSGADGQRLYLAGDRPVRAELPWVTVE